MIARDSAYQILTILSKNLLDHYIDADKKNPDNKFVMKQFA